MFCRRVGDFYQAGSDRLNLKHKQNSNSNEKADRRNRLADAESQVSADFLGIEVSAKEAIPNGKKHGEIAVVVLRMIAVMNMVIPRSNEYPLQPPIAPPDIEMHEIICDGVFQINCPKHPPRRKFKKSSDQNIWQVLQGRLDDGEPDAAHPVQISWRVMPLMCSPQITRVLQPVNPIRA